MALLDYKNDSDQDERLNPGSSDLYRKEQAGYDREFSDIANNFGDTADANQENTNIDKLKQAEETPAGQWNTNVNGPTDDKQSVSGRLSGIKKKGPMALIVALILGGGAGLTFLFAPGMGIIQLKEILTKDLNDQLAAMDIRSHAVFKAKLKSMKSTFGICSGPVNIRCKFSSLSGTQIKKFQAASFEVECDGGPCKTGLLSRNKITSIKFPDSTEAFTDPGKFVDAARSDAKMASQLNKAYNPKFAGLSDAIAMKFFSEKGISKKPVITEGTEEENQNKLKEAVKNGAKETTIGAVADDKADEAAKDKANTIDSGLSEEVDKVAETGTKATTGALKGAVKGIGVLGAADTACSIYRTSVAIEAGAKQQRAIQLARFAMTILTVADAIKAGEATPKQVEFVGNLVTATDTDKQIPSPNGDGTMVDNPFYGKNAFDSPGYKVAAYNEAPKLTARSLQYTVGGNGGLLTSLSSINSEIAKFGLDPNNARDTCRVIQNPLTRIGSFIVGIGLGAVTLGGSTAVSVGASTAAGIALGIAESMLIDMLAGTAIDNSTRGVAAGDAMFAGTASLLGGVAQKRGLSPLTKQGVKGYTVALQESRNRDIAIQKYEASQAPFDINNQYTFVGSLARNVSSITRDSRGIAAGMGSVFSQSLMPQSVSALADTYNPARYEQCDDSTYKRLGLAADVFCNLRYGLSDSELSLETDTVVNYMVDGGYIDETTGEAVDKPGDEVDLVKYIENCTNRTDPLGSSSNEDADDTTDGKICYDQDQKYQYFRVYLVDKSISDGMDGEEPSPAAKEAAQEITASTGIRGDDYPYKTAALYTASPLTYYYRECVDFVAWRLNVQSGITQAPFKFGGYGNAVSWKQNALSNGFAVDKTPKLGSVAWWAPNTTAVLTSGNVGHVAIVSEVKSDGSIIIEQYNGFAPPNDHKYSMVTIPASQVGNLEFLHIADIKGTS
jgi:surface antigen